MIRRDPYIDKLLELKENRLIKVVTGVPKCGKTTLLQLFKDYLQKNGVDRKKCITVSFQNHQNPDLKDYQKLYQHVLSHLIPKQMNYVFLDEIQDIPYFQKTIDSLSLRKNVDIYMTGSDAQLISSQMKPLMSGRYLEIHMMPLSFKEYYQLAGGSRKNAFAAYCQRGGFPHAAAARDDFIRRDYLQGLFNTLILEQVLERKKITDVLLLEDVIRYIFTNVGNIISAKKIADSLNECGRSTTAVTVDLYIEALLEAFVLYEVKRYDIKENQDLKSLRKLYPVDIGLRSFFLGEKKENIDGLLENILYLDFQRRGYEVKLGKIGTFDIDFVVRYKERKVYCQVTESVSKIVAYKRKTEAFKKIKDDCPKFLLTMDETAKTEEGVKHINILDFLLSDDNCFMDSCVEKRQETV